MGGRRRKTGTIFAAYASVFVAADTFITLPPDFDDELGGESQSSESQPNFDDELRGESQSSESQANLLAGPEDVTRTASVLTDPPRARRGQLPGYEIDEEATAYFERARLAQRTPDWAQPVPDYVDEIDRLEAAAVHAARMLGRQAEIRAKAEAMDRAEAIANAAVAAADAAFRDLSFDTGLRTTPPHHSRSRELPPLVYGEVAESRDRFTSVPTVDRGGNVGYCADDDEEQLGRGTPQPEVVARPRFVGGVPETIMTIPAPAGARPRDDGEPDPERSNRVFSWIKAKVRGRGK